MIFQQHALLLIRAHNLTYAGVSRAVFIQMSFQIPNISCERMLLKFEEFFTPLCISFSSTAENVVSNDIGVLLDVSEYMPFLPRRDRYCTVTSAI
jgi:hypothetical protein